MAVYKGHISKRQCMRGRLAGAPSGVTPLAASCDPGAFRRRMRHLPAHSESPTGGIAMRLRSPAHRSSHHEQLPSRVRRWRSVGGFGAGALVLLISILPAGTLRAELPRPGTDGLNVAISINVCLAPWPRT